MVKSASHLVQKYVLLLYAMSCVVRCLGKKSIPRMCLNFEPRHIYNAIQFRAGGGWSERANQARRNQNQKPEKKDRSGPGPVPTFPSSGTSCGLSFSLSLHYFIIFLPYTRAPPRLRPILEPCTTAATCYTYDRGHPQIQIRTIITR